MKLSAANGLGVAEFIASFGGIAEHSPWVAERAAAMRPFASREAMIGAFSACVMAADEAAQLALLRAHPDLAGRAKLTAHSAGEQKGAGLDSLSADEFARFTAMNEDYKVRFGFPFIFAVKGATKHQILEAFAARLPNSREQEFATALAQVCRILRFRLEAEIE